MLAIAFRVRSRHRRCEDAMTFACVAGDAMTFAWVDTKEDALISHATYVPVYFFARDFPRVINFWIALHPFEGVLA